MDSVRVKINGRLGNQLFQYAFARSIQLKYGGKLILDFMCFNSQSEPSWGNFLKYYNIVSYEYVDLDNYPTNKEPLIQRFIWKVLRRIKGISPKIRYYVERIDFVFLRLFGMYYMESYNSVNHVLTPIGKKIWVRGWFESKEFFKEHENIIRKELTLKSPIPKQYEELYNLLSLKNSLCVTIRRGDFVENPLYDVCTDDYFKKGIEYVYTNYALDILFVCSDDLNYSKKVYGDYYHGMKVVYQPSILPPWEALRLMSVCKYYVISNSTFAWWAQFLSERQGKVVVAPKKWRNEKPIVKDIYESEWILM